MCLPGHLAAVAPSTTLYSPVLHSSVLLPAPAGANLATSPPALAVTQLLSSRRTIRERQDMCEDINPTHTPGCIMLKSRGKRPSMIRFWRLSTQNPNFNKILAMQTSPRTQKAAQPTQTQLHNMTSQCLQCVCKLPDLSCWLLLTAMAFPTGLQRTTFPVVS